MAFVVLEFGFCGTRVWVHIIAWPEWHRIEPGDPALSSSLDGPGMGVIWWGTGGTCPPFFYPRGTNYVLSPPLFGHDFDFFLIGPI